MRKPGRVGSTRREKKISRKLEPYLFFLRGFGLGPGSDVSRTSPSRGEKKVSLLGLFAVGLGLVPYFALGPVADVSNPASSSGDQLVLGMNGVNGWFDVRGPELYDVGVASPSCRVSGSGKAAARTQPREISNSMRKRLRFGRNCSRKRVFGNDIYAVSVIGQVPVSTPSSFQAITVFWPTRGRRRTDVAEPTPAELRKEEQCEKRKRSARLPCTIHFIDIIDII